MFGVHNFLMIAAVLNTYTYCNATPMIILLIYGMSNVVWFIRGVDLKIYAPCLTRLVSCRPFFLCCRKKNLVRALQLLWSHPSCPFNESSR